MTQPNQSIPDKFRLPLFEHKWSIADELILLQALAIHGAENWAQAAVTLGPNFTAEKVREHYLRNYARHHQPHHLIPPKDEFAISQDFYNAYCRVKNNKEERRDSIEIGRQASLSIEAAHILSRKEEEKKRKFEKDRERGKVIPVQFGYAEKSRHFQLCPYNPEAELLVAHLELHSDDDAQTTINKLEVLREYNRQRKERKIIEREAVEQELLISRYKVISKPVLQPSSSSHPAEDSSLVMIGSGEEDGEMNLKNQRRIGINFEDESNPVTSRKNKKQQNSKKSSSKEKSNSREKKKSRKRGKRESASNFATARNNSQLVFNYEIEFEPRYNEIAKKVPPPFRETYTKLQQYDKSEQLLKDLVEYGRLTEQLKAKKNSVPGMAT